MIADPARAESPRSRTAQKRAPAHLPARSQTLALRCPGSRESSFCQTRHLPTAAPHHFPAACTPVLPDRSCPLRALALSHVTPDDDSPAAVTIIPLEQGVPCHRRRPSAPRSEGLHSRAARAQPWDPCTMLTGSISPSSPAIRIRKDKESNSTNSCAAGRWGRLSQGSAEPLVSQQQCCGHGSSLPGAAAALGEAFWPIRPPRGDTRPCGPLEPALAASVTSTVTDGLRTSVSQHPEFRTPDTTRRRE